MATWDDEKIKKLRKLWGQNKTEGEIAGALGPDFTRNSVIGKAHRLKLTGRASPTAAGSQTRGTGKRGRTISHYAKPEPARAAPNYTVHKIANVKPPRPVKQQAQTMAPVSLEEAQARNGCRWPFGDRPFTFCGQPKEPITETKIDPSYCPVHAHRSCGQRQ